MTTSFSAVLLLTSIFHHPPQHRFMINNDILRRIRYALDIANPEAVKIFKHAHQNIDEAGVLARIAREDDLNYIECSNQELGDFLDGLIIEKRGQRDPENPAQQQDNSKLTRNDILKKLRVALTYKEEDMLHALKLGGISMSSSELGALFRNPKHKHYRPCGQQALRGFLKGITEILRKK